MLPRYARRTRRIDETILSLYLAGANTRRIRRALAPLWGKSHLSKSAISRVVRRLQDLFAAWDRRDLSEEYYALVFLDALYLNVRLARRVVAAPVLVAVGAEPDGTRRVIGLRLAVREAATAWGDFVGDLASRGLPEPPYLILDGHRGLNAVRHVLRSTWAAMASSTARRRSNRPRRYLTVRGRGYPLRHTLRIGGSNCIIIGSWRPSSNSSSPPRIGDTSSFVRPATFVWSPG